MRDRKIKIGSVTVEYKAKYESDLPRHDELLAEIAVLGEVQTTMGSKGWKIVEQWAKAHIKSWNREIVDMCGDLETNKNRIRKLKRRRDGLEDWMMSFNGVASLPEMQQELQGIEKRLEE